MKETVKSFVIVVLVLLVVFLFIKNNKYYQKSQEKPEPKTIIVSDTLTNVVYDTLFINHVEKVKLPTTDTLILINDSIRIDSVFVEVPISVYKFDTCLTTDSTNLNIHIQNSGYAVTLDSLSYYFEYTPTHQKSNFFKEHFKFGLGAGAGYGCFSKQPDIFLGIGFYYCF